VKSPLLDFELENLHVTRPEPAQKISQALQAVKAVMVVGRKGEDVVACFLLKLSARFGHQ
jgi:hypothetical protein